MIYKNIFFAIKKFLFPGIDLHTRCRSKFLSKYFQSGAIKTLDAGCGNGALSYKAYLLGNKVLGVSFNETNIRNNTAFFRFLNCDSERLQFKFCNLYNIKSLNERFDQIICSETLEHITNDKLILKSFYEILNPGGVLHLCCPYSLHRKNNLNRQDIPEDGGHVRDGYTFEDYENLLTPLGFRITEKIGLGSPLLVFIDDIIRLVSNRFGLIPAIPIFILLLPLTIFDNLNPLTPLSIYVKCMKEDPYQV
jgi:SAM-dependent methyltransferase